MRFKTIQYIEWFKTKEKVAVDLCSSSVAQLQKKDLDIDWDALEITGDNFYGYPLLIEAIAERYGVKENNVVTTIGTSHALFLVCAALVDCGDVVLIESPAYEPILSVPEALEARVKRLDRKYEQAYGLSLEEFQSILTPATKLVLLTNLHNPSGVLFSRSFLSEAVLSAQEKGIPVVIDEIYLEFMDSEPTAFHLADNVLVISSLTKVFGLGHLRCGWVLAQPELVKRMRRIIDYIHVEGTFIGEKIAHQMFAHLDTIKSKNKALIEENMSTVKDLIDRETSLSWVEPAGGVVCFPRIETGLTGDELAKKLRTDHDTAIVPGSFFERPQHFRIGFGGDSDNLVKGLAHIREVLSENASE
ncbi:MAG: pyridoxal phosphate-dependent aminotransferase [Candidatus Aminicenantes bacterium]|nr:MAG: pyridoxal phosphate-dependent aminotransferase [Candidatus Aminicenantes bacterium]